MKCWLSKLSILLTLRLLLLVGADSIARPQLAEGVYLLGDFDAVSDYDNTDKYNLTRPLAAQHESLYELGLDNSTVTLLESGLFNGTVSGLYALANNTLLAVVDGTPVLYDGSLRQLANWDSATAGGNVLAVYVDGSTVYLGGDFSYHSSAGAVVYDAAHNQLEELPFHGFSNGSSVSAIASHGDNIVFGGTFTELGNVSLQSVSNSSANGTGSSLIEPEQPINLDFAAVFTANTASGSNARSIVCPSSDSSWTMDTAQDGGLWTAQLASTVNPSKLRIYNGDDDSVRLFRITSAPSNSILNLTYIDPTTLELRSCDAYCPLSVLSDLHDGLNSADNVTDGVYQIEQPDDLRGTLQFSRNYQEFALVNPVAMNSITIHVLDHNGNTGELRGFEMYQYGITVNANNTLNAAGCNADQQIISSSRVLGDLDWERGYNADYMTVTIPQSEVVANRDSGIRYNTNLVASGNYTFLLYTTGCAQDNTCNNRGIVTATLYAGNGTTLSSGQIYQTNSGLKYDQIFSGFLGDSAQSPYLELTISQGTGSENVTFVADALLVQFDSIDYSSRGSLSIPLNGLFEYSPQNFSRGISHPVANSTINRLGSALSQGAQVNGVAFNGSSIYVAGQFNSSHGNNFFASDLGSGSFARNISTPAVTELLDTDDGLVLVGSGLAVYNGSYHSLDVPNNISQASPLQFNGTDYLLADSSAYYLSNGQEFDGSSTLGLNVSSAANSSVASYAYGRVVAFDLAADGAVFIGNDSSVSAIDGIYRPSGAVQRGVYLNRTSVAMAGDDVTIINSNHSTALGVDFNNSTIHAINSAADLLLVGFSGSADYSGSHSATGLLAYNLTNHGFAAPIESGAVSAMDTDPATNATLIAGNFSASGCSNFCLYNGTLHSVADHTLSGTVNDVQYYTANAALVGGNFTLDGHQTYLAIFNRSSRAFRAAGLGDVPGPVEAFQLANGSSLNSVYVMGADYVGHLANNDYTSLLETNDTFSDIALVNTTAPTANSHAVGSVSQSLLLTGNFNLDGYGSVSSALHNGSDWTPLVISGSELDTSRSQIRSVLRTSRGYSPALSSSSQPATSSPNPSSNGGETDLRYFTRGQVVGVGCALAAGTTLLLTSLGGLAYMFSRRNTVVGPLQSRVGEQKLMSAVPPGEVINNLNKAKGY